MITRKEWNDLRVGDSIVTSKGIRREIIKVSNNGSGYIEVKKLFGDGITGYLYSDLRKTHSIFKKINYKCFLVKDDVYNRQTLFFIGSDITDFENQFKLQFDVSELPDKEMYSAFFENHTNRGRTIFTNNICVVLLKDMDLPYLVHELFHAVEYHFEKIGIKHGEDSSESWAYYIQFLMEQFILKSK